MTSVYTSNFPHFEKKFLWQKQLVNVNAHTPKHLVIQRSWERTVEDEHKLMGVVFELQTNK